MQVVSIIIPCYNHGHYLGEALESILAQTYPAWEAIVVDDGSTDDTRQVAARYVERDARVRYLHQENAGESAARNTGLSVARGEYIAFLDADDMYMPTALAEHVRFLSEHARYAVSYADGYFCDALGRRLNRVSQTRETSPEGKILEHLVLSPCNIFINSTLVRGEAVHDRRVRFDPDLVIGPDWDFWIQLAAQEEFGYLDSVTFLYRVHDTNITRTAGRERRQRDLLKGRLKVMSAPWFASLSPETRSAFFEHLLGRSTTGMPTVQQEIMESPQFSALSAKRRAKVLRHLATQSILSRDPPSTVLAHLDKALGLMPNDPMCRALSFLHATDQRLAHAVILAWRLTVQVRRTIASAGRPRPQSVPDGLRVHET